MRFHDNREYIVMKSLEELGYMILPKMDELELNWFRSVINETWTNRIILLYPELEKEVLDQDITTYHRLRGKVDHEKLWKKDERLFSKCQVEELKQTNFYKNLQNQFGVFSIAPQTTNGKYYPDTEEVYWRLVSPGVITDVGGPHADKWFHQIHDFDFKDLNGKIYTHTLKLWIPIFCEPELNGLMISEGSHKRDWAFKTEIRSGVPYPVFNDNTNELSLKLISTSPGQVIVFNEKLIHAGAINQGKFTRVSAEITMLL